MIFNDSKIDKKHAEEKLTHINKNLKQNGFIISSGENIGAENIIPLSFLLSHIGGKEDDNRTLTNRMLIMLEGECVNRKDSPYDMLDKILDKYNIPSSESHIPLHLLNDIIRYWRTIAVDYEFKRIAGKPWVIRNLKLGFSRKVMYFSSIISIASSCEKQNKKDHIKSMLSMPPLRRIYEIDNSPEKTISRKIFRLYDDFLGSIRLEDNRQKLDLLSKKASSPYEISTQRKDLVEGSLSDSFYLYRNMKDKSYILTDYLYDYIKENFPGSHPIHKLMVL